MIFEVIKFEIRYRLNRPATYIYFFILLLLTFLAVTWDGISLGGDLGKIKQNASIVLHGMAGTLSLLPGLFFASAVMGVPILRDFEHKMESLIFTTPITKFSYLFGRFIGSFIILLFISTGFVIGAYVGCQMPWIDKDTLLDAGLMQYVRPWLVMMVSNLFVFSAIFFASGALSRKMLFVYLQAIILLAIYLMAGTLIGDVENIEKAALFDPFGYYALSADTRYWTVAEKNSLIVPLTGYLLKNRLIWLGISLAVTAVTYSLFKFRALPSPLFRKKKKLAVLTEAAQLGPIPFAAPSYTIGTELQKVRTLSALYFKEIYRSIPFLGIGIIGIILLVVNAGYANQWYGQDLYPVTSMIAGFVADQIFPIIAIMALFYAGEMIWKESQINFSQIFDSLPVGYATPIVSKYIALAGVTLLYLLCLIPIGIIIQLFKGFNDIEISIYFIVLIVRVYVSMLIYMAVMLFFQAIVSNKFVGYILSVLFYLYMIFSGQMKIYNNLLVPNSGSFDIYSDMNGFAAGVEKFIVLKLYWLGLSLILLVLAVLFYQRGTEASFKARLRNVKQRFKFPEKAMLTLGVLIMVLTGGYYWYNISVINKYTTPDQEMDLQANYEKTLKKAYDKAAQPSVSNIVAKVELYPETGDLGLNATVTYKNLMPQTISQLLVQLPPDEDINYPEFKFSAPATLVKKYKDLRFWVYKLRTPLKPGDSIQLVLKGKRIKKGFTNDGDDFSYVKNGTFITNQDIFPQLGYSGGLELQDDKERKKRGLKDQEGLPPRTDERGRMLNLFGQRGRTNLDITIGTLASQTAIAPGYLAKKWTKDNRAYFHYKMDKPVFNFFNIISGEYAVKRDKWHDVNLEIYYHKKHSYNLGIMMASLKGGLDYDSKNFSPYSYRQVRIIEFPAYRSFAQSFPNTIPFSESIGFLFKKSPGKLDMSFYVTAHELGHQWWAHQVCESDTKGNQMYSEGLAQYSALMLLKHTLSQEELARYLKYELDGYLRGRSGEPKHENPIDQTDGQDYIHYQKASLAYFAMQDYIGEDKMNSALRKLIANYGNKDKYPTSDVLTGYMKEVTPDSLKFVVDDLFSKITLFENRVINPTAKKTANGYTVTLPLQTIKYYADKEGAEKTTPIHDYIDVGVYTADATGNEKLTYIKRYKFTKNSSTITVNVKDKPVRAAIDPLYKMVDRNTEDNKAQVTIAE